MHLPSPSLDGSPTVILASKFVASKFATIFLDHSNFNGHANISHSNFLFSFKYHYLGKVVNFI